MNKTMASISGATAVRQGESRAAQLFNGILGGITTGVSAIAQLAPMFTGSSAEAGMGAAGAVGGAEAIAEGLTMFLPLLL